MLLGKRPRPHMKRTTSMKDVAADLAISPAPPAAGCGARPCIAGDLNLDRRRNVSGESGLAPAVSRRSSGDYVAAIETASFLRVCALCEGFLLPGRDIFMYRGEVAFCSRECREQQIKLDERKEKAKCSLASRKTANQPQTKASASDASAGNNGETAAAG